MKRVCVDVGGTFTDCLVLEESGDLRLFKAATTPGDPTAGCPAGNVVPGPAVIEETTTRVVVPEGFRLTVDERKTYTMER